MCSRSGRQQRHSKVLRLHQAVAATCEVKSLRVCEVTAVVQNTSKEHSPGSVTLKFDIEVSVLRE